MEQLKILPQLDKEFGNNSMRLSGTACTAGIVQLALHSWHCTAGIVQLALHSWHCTASIAQLAQLALHSWHSVLDQDNDTILDAQNSCGETKHLEMHGQWPY
jgi:hypothetical protein